METQNYTEYIGPIFFASFAIVGLYLKRKSIPKYIHIIALLSGIIGLLIGIYASLYAEEKITISDAIKGYTIYSMVGPAMTYLGYGFYGLPKNTDSDFDSE